MIYRVVIKSSHGPSVFRALNWNLVLWEQGWTHNFISLVNHCGQTKWHLLASIYLQFLVRYFSNITYLYDYDIKNTMDYSSVAYRWSAAGQVYAYNTRIWGFSDLQSYYSLVIRQPKRFDKYLAGVSFGILDLRLIFWLCIHQLLD